MNSNGGNMKQYNQDDIRRYAEGKMSGEEMHGIEKAALADPFLADAIEGFTNAIQKSGSNEVMSSRDRLQEEFNARVKKSERKQTPVINIRWWQAAAAAAVIITAAVLGYQSYKDKKDDLVLSLNEKTAGISDSAISKPDTPGRKISITGSNADTTAGKADVATSKSDIASAKPEDLPTATSVPGIKEAEESPERRDDLKATLNKVAKADQNGNQANKEVNAQSDKAVAGDSNAAFSWKRKANLNQATARTVEIAERAKNIRVRSYASPDSLNPPAPTGLDKTLAGKVAGVTTSSRPASDRKKDAVSYFRGQIVTSDDKPLSNAVLKLSDKNQVYTTDNNGNFAIPSADSIINVDVTMIGQRSRHFRLEKNNDSNRLILPDAAAALSEVVVVGYGTQRKKDMTASTTVRIQNAEPVGGWTAFEAYIEKNKNPSLINGPAQTTTILFQVNKNDSLSNFKVTKSISALHDQEVIRLIREGPKWKLLKGRKTNVSVTINF